MKASGATTQGKHMIATACSSVTRLATGILVCAGAFATNTLAQGYPAKPIRLTVGFSAGGSTDITARLVAQILSDSLNQQVIVENRPGAGGTLADEKVARSPADGYSLLMMAGSATITPALRKVPYDVERDLAPVSLITSVPYVLVVHPSLPVRDVKGLIALAHSMPGKLSYGSSGVGTSPHLAGELFNLMAGVRTVHVPFKGAAESVIATAGGQIEMNYPTTAAALPFLESGRLRPLAVTSARRVASLPSIPTIHESGLPGYDRFSWYGLLGPAGMPKDIVARLHAVLDKEVNSPLMRDAFGKQGMQPQTNTPEEFAALIRRELTENARVVKLAGVKSE